MYFLTYYNKKLEKTICVFVIYCSKEKKLIGTTDNDGVVFKDGKNLLQKNESIVFLSKEFNL